MAMLPEDRRRAALERILNDPDKHGRTRFNTATELQSRINAEIAQMEIEEFEKFYNTTLGEVVESYIDSLQRG